MFKTIKAIYGKSNCINVWKDRMQQIDSPIVAVNDLIDKYIRNKAMLNSIA